MVVGALNAAAVVGIDSDIAVCDASITDIDAPVELCKRAIARSVVIDIALLRIYLTTGVGIEHGCGCSAIRAIPSRSNVYVRIAICVHNIAAATCDIRTGVHGNASALRSMNAIGKSQNIKAG